MKLRKEKILFDIALGTGLYLLDSLRDRLVESVGDISERTRDSARDLYDTASDRASRAADVIRGEDYPVLGKTAAVLLGVGVGVGIGILLAPARGAETRHIIADKLWDRPARDKEWATGTHGA